MDPCLHVLVLPVIVSVFPLQTFRSLKSTAEVSPAGLEAEQEGFLLKRQSGSVTAPLRVSVCTETSSFELFI